MASGWLGSLLARRLTGRLNGKVIVRGTECQFGRHGKRAGDSDTAEKRGGGKGQLGVEADWQAEQTGRQLCSKMQGNFQRR